MSIGKERWEAAIKHAREFLDIYKGLPGGVFGAFIIQTKIDLYEKGDRSEVLLDELENIE